MTNRFAQFFATTLFALAFVVTLAVFDAAMWNGPPTNWAGDATL